MQEPRTTSSPSSSLLPVCHLCPSQSVIMVKLNILAGGSIAFIASYLFDSVDRTLTLVKRNPSGENTTWVEKSVINPSIL